MRSLAFVALLLCTFGSRDRQQAQPAAAAPASQDSALYGMPAKAAGPIQKAQDDIYKAQPEIEATTIAQDKAALGRAYHMYRSYREEWSSQAGSSQLSDEDAGRLLGAVWADYRERTPTTFGFNANKIISLAKEYGGVHVMTTPKGASVWLDGKQWDGVTGLTGFTTAGKRKIRVGGLPGYKDDEESVVVVAATVVEFQRTLAKQK